MEGAVIFFCYFCLRLDKLYIAFLVRVEQKQDAQPGDKPIQHHRQHNLSLYLSLKLKEEGGTITVGKK